MWVDVLLPDGRGQTKSLCTCSKRVSGDNGVTVWWCTFACWHHKLTLDQFLTFRFHSTWDKTLSHKVSALLWHEGEIDCAKYQIHSVWIWGKLKYKEWQWVSHKNYYCAFRNGERHFTELVTWSRLWDTEVPDPLLYLGNPVEIERGCCVKGVGNEQ